TANMDLGTLHWTSVSSADKDSINENGSDDSEDSDDAKNYSTETKVDDESEDVAASSVGNWTNVSSTQRSFPFTSREELCIQPPSITTNIYPLDIYSLFIAYEILEEIVKETNRYADREISKTRLRGWYPADRTEIKKLLGLILYMGIVS
ncbi:hypothetical protein SK128_021861, partial [Halocaridina rubra]